MVDGVRKKVGQGAAAPELREEPARAKPKAGGSKGASAVRERHVVLDRGPERSKAPAPAPAHAPRTKDLFPVAITVADVATPAKAADVLARMLAAPDLADRVTAAEARVAPAAKERFSRALSSLALVADAALTTLDYDRMSTGWDGFGDVSKFPTSKSAYRHRAYREDLLRTSEPRQERSRAELGAALDAALAAGDPATALEHTLVDRFFAEVGVAPETRADWKPTAAAVTTAVEGELLIPLRALYAAAAHLDHRFVPLGKHTPAELDAQCRAAVEQVIRHVGEGDFASWRFEHEASRAQLASLTPAQEAAFRAPTSIETKSRSGKTLTTRDEQGLGLPWVTKIGGPSHGFDMISQCLLPLLMNARNNAIVVDDESHAGAARSILRMLPTQEGKPMLYLEMLQVDYPYERTTRVTREEVRAAIIEHALTKAQAMGVPLAIAPSKWESAEALVRDLGRTGERTPLVFVLEPSTGVFESSDTLLGAHHAPQTERALAKIPEHVPLFAFHKPWCYVVDPKQD